MDGFVDGVAAYNDAHGTAVVALGWDKAKQDGSFTGDFEDINKGKTLTESLIDQGADVILPVAGQVGEGSAAAALENPGVSVIWVDNDGYDTLPAKYHPVLLTSVLKNTEDAVATIVTDDVARVLRSRRPSSARSRTAGSVSPRSTTWPRRCPRSCRTSSTR